MKESDVDRVLRYAKELQAIFGGPAASFGQGYSLSTIQQVIRAWEATSALADMFFAQVNAGLGIVDHH
jgi:hypothetical protein